MLTRLLRISSSIAVILLLAVAHAAEPAMDAVCDAPEHSYDAFLRLPAPGPEQLVLLDHSGDDALAIVFGTDATRVLRGKAELGRGPAAAPGQVHIRRRMPLIEVICDGRRLVRTWCALPPGGTVAAARGARIEDLYVQPIAPIAFADEFFYPDRQAAEWEPLSGEWKVGIYRDDLIERDHGDKGPIGASWYEITAAQRALSATGHDFWDDYHASVAATADDKTTVGLAFGVRDTDNYGVLSIRPGGDGEGLAQVDIIRQGRVRKIAERTIACRAGTWYRLSATVHGAHVVCVVAGETVFSGILEDLLPGRVGVYADGAGVARLDDMTVASTDRDADAFDRTTLGECWLPSSGDWSTSKGKLEGRGQNMVRCERVGPERAATEVGVSITPLSGMGGVYLNWSAGSGYALGVEASHWTLLKYVGGKKEILAREDIAGARDVRLSLRWQEGRLQARVGAAGTVVYDFDAPAGACGLFSAGKATFSGFSVTEPSPAVTVVDEVNGSPRYVPGKAEGTRRPVMGYIWRPTGGYWPSGPVARADADSTIPGLRPTPRGNAIGALWYYQPCPGDAVMSAEACTVPEGATLGVTIAADGANAASGYAAELSASSPLHLRLLRAGEILAQMPVDASAPPDLSIARDGEWVSVRCANTGLAFRDTEPLLGDRCGAYASGEGIGVGGVSLGNRGGLAYSFKGVEPDWQPEVGEWIVHSGMACIDWDYWLTGIGEPQAMAYNINPQPHNLHVDFGVSEYTKGFVNGDHKHYPYHDISLVTCASSRDIGSGYRYLIGAEGGRVTRLLRLGQVVAETTDRRFYITMGGHCNEPRAIQVIANQHRGRLTLHLNGMPAIDYTDPEPLSGGLVGIGCAGCSADFRDYWMAPITY